MRGPGRPAAVAFIVALAAVLPASAQEGPKPPAPAAAPDPGYTPGARDAALRAALRFLDENIPRMQEGGSPQRPYTVATSAWAGLLLLARKGAPRLPGRGLEQYRDLTVRYVERVAKAYDRSAKEEKKRKPERPVPTPGGFPGGREPPGEATQFVWPISMAAHLLAESAARGWKAGEARSALAKVVEVLEASQQPDGGWGHDDASRAGMGLPAIQIPKPWGGGTLDYPATLLAASNCALSALGVAHRALGTRRAPALEKGRKYYAGAQSADGTFPYDPSQRHGEGRGVPGDFGSIEVSRTAGAVFALGCAGAPGDDAVLGRAAGAVEGRTEQFSEGHGSATLTLQLAALGCRARGGESWDAFRRVFIPRILAAQDGDGAFRCVCRAKSPAVTCDGRPLPFAGPGTEGFAASARAYVTSIHVLVLALDADEPPRGLPPIDVRGGTATDR